MESFLWALNLLAVCLLCGWALKEDNRPPDAPDNTGAEPPSADKAKAQSKAGPAAAARRQQFPRK